MRVDAANNKMRLVRAVRDVISEQGRAAVTAKEIACKAGVGTATLYRHFENKDTLIDEVSIVRWMQMEQTARQGAQMGGSSLEDIIRTLDFFTRMINADNQFIDIVGVKIGWSPEPIRPIRRAFETPFTDMWVRCQREGAIRRSAHPRDAIDMAGSVRNGERRLQMLTMVVGGFCTGAVDAEALVHDMVVSGKLKARTSF